jgi:hypothetical protein
MVLEEAVTASAAEPGWLGYAGVGWGGERLGLLVVPAEGDLFGQG